MTNGLVLTEGRDTWWTWGGTKIRQLSNDLLIVPNSKLRSGSFESRWGRMVNHSTTVETAR